MRRLDQGARQAPRCGVGIQNIPKRLTGRESRRCNTLSMTAANRRKVQAPVKKRLYGDLIGRVQHGRRGAAGARRGSRQPEAREAFCDPAARSRAARSARRSSDCTPEATRSGHASACAMGVLMSGAPSCASSEPSAYSTSECTRLCGCTTTSTCDFGQVEQQRRLDHLEPLVHQRRGIDRDLAAHFPVRMIAGLIGRDAVEPRRDRSGGTGRPRRSRSRARRRAPSPGR